MFAELDQLLANDIFTPSPDAGIITLTEGERREVAILFADIKGFTALSERLDPEQVQAVLDRLLQLFTRAIKQNDGYIDKYEGDLVMALFGAKAAGERDTEQAIRAGLEMLEKLDQFNAALARTPQLAGVRLGVRIGLNTGLVTTGKVGEKREGDFTVYGDAVNLASRMESHAPVNRILLPVEAAQRARDVFEFDNGGEIEVKGKSKPVTVSIVKGLKPRPAPRWQIRQSAYVGRAKELALLAEKYDSTRMTLKKEIKTDNDFGDGKKILEEKNPSESVVPVSSVCYPKPVVVGVKAPAGFGKSRFVFEFLKTKAAELQDVEFTPRPFSPFPYALWGQTPPLNQNAYCVFVALIKAYLKIDQTDSLDEIKRKLEFGLNALEADLWSELDIRVRALKKDPLGETEVHDLDDALVMAIQKKALHDTLPMLGHLLGVKYDDVRLQLDTPALRPHLQTAIRYFLEAAAAVANRQGLPLIVILEDLHWLDEASQATIEFLMYTLNLEERRAIERERNVPGTLENETTLTKSSHEVPGTSFFKQFLFILLYRPEYLPPKALAYDADFSEIELPPLSGADGHELLRSLAREFPLNKEVAPAENTPQIAGELPSEIERQVLEKSAGNPFYIEEWVNLISEMPSLGEMASLPIPPTLTALILTRIDRLDKDVKLLLQKAAVIGRQFFVVILAEIEKKLARQADIPDELRHLAIKDFIHPQDEQAYLFKHIITREVAYNTLLIANRKILHKIIAEIIEEKFAANLSEFYYDLANHYDKAEVTDKAIEYLEKAGDQAKKRFENERALEFYERLLKLIGQDESFAGLKVDILIAKGGILEFTTEIAEAERIFKDAIRLSEGQKDNTRRGKASSCLMRLFSRWEFPPEEVFKYGIRDLKLSHASGDRYQLMRANKDLGIPLLKHDSETARSYLETAYKLAEDVDSKCEILYRIGMSYGRSAKALEYFEEARKLGENIEARWFLAWIYWIIGAWYELHGDYQKLYEYCERAVELAEVSKDKPTMVKRYYNLSDASVKIGRFDKALAYCKKAIDLDQEIGYRSMSISDLGAIYKAMGDYEKAKECFDELVEHRSRLEGKYGTTFWTIEKADLLYLLRQYEDARTWNKNGLQLAEQLQKKELIFKGRVLAAKIDFAQGQRESAIADLQTMLTAATDPEEQADLHYELWRMKKDLTGLEDLLGLTAAEHRTEALRLFQELVAQAPKWVYKKRIEELTQIVGHPEK